jgi:hypothetical protein
MPRRKVLSIEQVLAWADAHRDATGRWPTAASGCIAGVPDETWASINDALRRGLRGLPGGGSLPDLLAEHRGKPERQRKAPLTEEEVLAWADAHFRRIGRWPNAISGPVLDAPGESWHALNLALGTGHRGLPGGDSLARLLDRHRRKRETGMDGSGDNRTPRKRPTSGRAACHGRATPVRSARPTES